MEVNSLRSWKLKKDNSHYTVSIQNKKTKLLHRKKPTRVVYRPI